MKIYLAARFGRIDEMREVARRLETLGHKITSRWISTHPMVTDAELSAADDGKGAVKASLSAVEDIEDIVESDAVVSFTEPPRSATRGGRHVEFGFGVGIGRLMIVVGPKEHIFHFLPDVQHFDTAAELFEEMLTAKSDALGLSEPDPESLILNAPSEAQRDVLFETEAQASGADAIKGR